MSRISVDSLKSMADIEEGVRETKVCEEQCEVEGPIREFDGGSVDFGCSEGIREVKSLGLGGERVWGSGIGWVTEPVPLTRGNVSLMCCAWGGCLSPLPSGLASVWRAARRIA